ncbi:MAG TPA: hypothetical protein VFQ45_23750 [Longimicrobium sp.]|nr:hypothetical protein [Longimicrobium sp.]
MTLPRRLLFLLPLLLLALSPAAAQQVRITGDESDRAARIVRDILARNAYTWIDRDTILPRDTRITGDLVIYDAEVRLEGIVDGAVAVLGGDLFVRPGAVVPGPIAVLGGGVYPSGLAAVGEIVHADPRAQVRVETQPTGGGRYAAAVEVTPPPADPLISPGPVTLPTYDRVNGLTLGAAATLLPTRDAEGPRLTAWASYRFEQENHWGGGVRASLPLGVENFQLRAEASRATRTNDRWIRDDVSNSVRAATFGDDYRDYWDSDLVRVTLERPVGKPLIAGESWLGPRVGLQRSHDRALAAQGPWALFGREGLERENPAAAEGTITSLLAGFEYHWRARTSRFDADVMMEHAWQVPGSDDELGQIVVDGVYFAFIKRVQTLRVRFRGMGSAGHTVAPPQRQGILGGSGTLPTLGIAHFRGENLVFVESAYAVPFQAIVVPLLGSPFGEVVHAIGGAWNRDDKPGWVQNVGVGIRFTLFFARVMIDPAEKPPTPAFTFGLALPQR